MTLTLLGRLWRRLKPVARSSRGSPEALKEIAALEAIVGEAIRDESLYRRALRHRSVLRSAGAEEVSNERLEFLGDAVLGMVVAAYLYNRFPNADEGFLTRLRSKLVNGTSLARCANRIDLGQLLEMSANMDRIDGRQNMSILSDAYEAVIGAVYLDHGMNSATRFIERTLLAQTDVEQLASRRDNHKSRLLEYCQARSWPQPTYELTSEEGPDHDKIFTVSVVVNGKPAGTGTAGNKKTAEQEAARGALSVLEALDGGHADARIDRSDA